MENKYITTGLVAGIIILMMATFALGASVTSLNIDINQYQEDKVEYATEVEGYKTDIKEKIDEINDLQYQLDNYECPDCPECPEPETVYINTTEYIYEYVYVSNAIFDVNRDRVVDHEDVCSVWAYINNGLPLVQNIFYDRYPNAWDLLYDVNADGCVDVDDVNLILEHSGEVW